MPSLRGQFFWQGGIYLWVRPSETAIFLGRGGSRSNVLKDTLETFDRRGERMIEKYPHDYLPKIA
jgi:hypothetical protein